MEEWKELDTCIYESPTPIHKWKKLSKKKDKGYRC